MEKSKKSSWKIPWKGIIATFLCSVVALALVFSKVAKPADILKELKAYPLGYFVAALTFVLAAWVIDGQRIGMLTKAMGQSIAWWELAIVLGAANFLTLVTPFAGGGGALVIYFLYRRGLPSASGTALVMAAGMAGQLSLSVLSFVMFSAVSNVPPNLARYFTVIRFGAAVYIIILLTLIGLITRNERFFRWVFEKRGAESRSAKWLAEFRATFRLFLSEKRAYYAACMAVATCYYGVYYLGGFTLLTGFGAYHPWLRYAISVFFGIAPVFSPIPGGAGVSEGLAYLVLNELPKDALGTFIILWRAAVFYVPILLGGAIFASLTVRWIIRSPMRAKKDSLSDENGDSVILSAKNDHHR